MKLQRILHSDATRAKPSTTSIYRVNPVVKVTVVKKRKTRGWIA